MLVPFFRRLAFFLPLASPFLSGCLIPISLDQENSTDGGKVLAIKGSEPGFGVKRLFRQTEPVNFSINIESDAPQLYGRLYRQVDETCCDLVPMDPSVTHFVKEATQVVSVGPGEFRVVFDSVQPCLPPVTVSAMAYVVPVIATGPFLNKDPSTLEAQGVVDRSHFWGIRCP